MLNILFLTTLLLRYGLRYELDFKMYIWLLSKSILSKEYKSQIILVVPVGNIRPSRKQYSAVVQSVAPLDKLSRLKYLWHLPAVSPWASI